MILLFTDFGHSGPYVGQMRTVLRAEAIGVPVVDLMHDAPAFQAGASGMLLDALCRYMPPRCVVLAVVDPGVGTNRRALIARCGDRWLVGPDNGLLAPSLRSTSGRAWSIPIPDQVSATFHGRDVFAPAAAWLATGVMPRGAESISDWIGRDSPDHRERVIFIDGYGNAMTGISAATDMPAGLRIAGRELRPARTFADVAAGEPFFYANSLGLVEIAVNQGNAASALGLTVGTQVEPVTE